jgi:tetratricopeptide (TPR) repeat protein
LTGKVIDKKRAALTLFRGDDHQLAALGLLILCIILAYGNSLTNGFAYDDDRLIVMNRLIRSTDTLTKLVSSDYWVTRRDPMGELPSASGLYRPLVSLSYAFNYAVGGLNAVGYHLVNVLAHALVTWLLYLVALQMRFPSEAALVSAVLFAIHPLHTEAVTNIVGRAELFMALAVLGGLWLAVTGRRVWSLVAFTAGLFSKEQAIMLPVLLLLYDACTAEPILGLRSAFGAWRPRRFVAAFSRYAGYVFVLAVYLAIRKVILGGLAPPPTPLIDNPLADLEWIPRVLTALKVAGLYIWLCIWPVSLSVDYSFDAIKTVDSIWNFGVLWGSVTWATLAGLSIWSFFYGDRRITFATGLTLIFFLPVSNLIILIGTIMGERLFYLPSAGLCLLVGLGWVRLRRIIQGRPVWEWATVSFLVIINIMFLGRTVLRNLDWESSETAFKSAVTVVPQSAKVQAMLGVIATNRKEWQTAQEAFTTALALYPAYSLTDPEVSAKIGVVLLTQGEVSHAVQILEQVVALDRDNELGQYNLALAYSRAGRYEDAEVPYRRYLTLVPDSADAYNGLSYVLAKQQRYAEAVAMAAEAIHLRPKFIEAYYNYGRGLEKLDRIEEAVSAYEQLLSLDPTQERIKGRLDQLRKERGILRDPLQKKGHLAMEKPS